MFARSFVSVSCKHSNNFSFFFKLKLKLHMSQANLPEWDKYGKKFYMGRFHVGRNSSPLLSHFVGIALESTGTSAFQRIKTRHAEHSCREFAFISVYFRIYRTFM